MKKLYVEIADTPVKREYGLMDRKRLGRNSGMLFKFPYATNLSFWMRDTYIPLDIAFINEDGKIMKIKEGVPLTTKPIVANVRCRYALEVNKGWFEDNGVREGSVVRGLLFEKTSQMSLTTGPFDNALPAEPEHPMQEGMPQQPSQGVMLNKSHKEMLEDANLRGKDLIIIYQTKGSDKHPSITLPPKSISPPYSFEPNAEGDHDAIVKVWDNQDAGWKSFIIDNIIEIQEKEPDVVPKSPEVIEENSLF